MVSDKFLKLSDEVKRALDSKQPVVALESTIISHGMSYPANIETARLLEKTIRDNGAIPATIALISGKICVGLSDDELEFLATSDDISKASRRDLPIVLGLGKHAATTVAATMICASMAGIKFFATGGIGGVHRGATDSFDISADLTELAQTNCVVVSAGVKAILDLKLTMEKLETLGVPVIGFQTDELPAFYYRDSGISVPFRANSEIDVAKIVNAKYKLGLTGGVLVGNPIPKEDEMAKGIVESSITMALDEANKMQIIGSKITPFLLSQMEKITNGNSLTTNISLVKNNAAVCARIAVEYFKLLKE